MKQVKFLKDCILYSDLIECLQLDIDSLIEAECLAPEADIAFKTKKGMFNVFWNKLEEAFPNLTIFPAYLGEGENSDSVLGLFISDDEDFSDKKYDFLIKYNSYVIDVMSEIEEDDESSRN